MLFKNGVWIKNVQQMANISLLFKKKSLLFESLKKRTASEKLFFSSSVISDHLEWEIYDWISWDSEY